MTKTDRHQESNLVHFSLKMWHLVAKIVMIFLIINWLNFVYYWLIQDFYPLPPLNLYEASRFVHPQIQWQIQWTIRQADASHFWCVLDWVLSTNTAPWMHKLWRFICVQQCNQYTRPNVGYQLSSTTPLLLYAPFVYMYWTAGLLINFGDRVNAELNIVSCDSRIHSIVKVNSWHWLLWNSLRHTIPIRRDRNSEAGSTPKPRAALFVHVFGPIRCLRGSIAAAMGRSATSLAADFLSDRELEATARLSSSATICGICRQSVLLD